MKLEPCIILNTYLNFIDSQPEILMNFILIQKCVLCVPPAVILRVRTLRSCGVLLRVNTPFPSNALRLSMCLLFVIYCKIIMYNVYNDVELVLHEKRKNQRVLCLEFEFYIRPRS